MGKATEMKFNAGLLNPDLFWATVGVLLWALPCSAQYNAYYDTKTLHFGFHVGFNSSSHRVHLSDSLNVTGATNLRYITPGFGPGFQLGIISDLRLHEYLALRFTPTLMFSQRNFSYQFQNNNKPTPKSVQMANVDLPLTVKFRSKRMKNYRVYVLGGLKGMIDMASQEKVVDDIDKVKLRRLDFAYETGMGLDLYLPYFKLSPEIRVANGFRNVLVPETHVYSNFMESLRSRTWIFSFTFE
jgi:hypothetical protein